MSDPKFCCAQETLLPCPFCGKQPVSEWYSAGESDDCGYWGIDCCGAFAYEDDEETAVKLWNTRADVPAAKAPLSDLEKAVHFGIWSTSGPTNGAEIEMVERWCKEAWEDFQKQAPKLCSHSPAAHASRLAQLEAFVRQVATCEQSDNQNIRRAKELCVPALGEDR